MPPTSDAGDLGAIMDEVSALCAAPDGFTVEDIQNRLGERTWPLLLILLPLPFLTPLPTPGLSAPFGLLLALVGVGLLLGRPPRLPARLARVRCPPGFFARVIAAAARTIGRVRRVLRPRLGWLAGWRGTRAVAGVVVAISGLLLALPLPIPFSNAVPAWTILILGAGLAQRDGVALLGGALMFLVALAFFAILAWGVATGASSLI